jgi:hypothetical protein
LLSCHEIFEIFMIREDLDWVLRSDACSFRTPRLEARSSLS